MAEPLSIKILETLKNLLDMYEYPNEEVLVLEAVANGIDAKAKKIEINFESNDSGHYVTFLNNGPPMNKADFENYHTISSSTKTKGEGIGFAGVGAKIFLAAWEQAEILTISGRDNKVLVSKMFRRRDNVEYDSSLNGIPITQLLGNKRLNHKYGTSYRVKVSARGFEWLKNNIDDKLQFWFNYALLSKTLELTVNGKIVKPWQPPGEKIFKKISHKKQVIPCYIWISEKDIPEDERHIVYSVFGKRIKNESVDWANQIKGENSQRVSCMADVSILAQQLVANKENFKKSIYTNSIRSIVKKAFFDELESRGLIFKHEDVSAKTNVVVNELTKRLDKILQNPDLKFLNPFSNPKIHYVTLRDEDGNITIKEVEGQQSVAGTNTGDGFDSSGISSGDEQGSGFFEDDKGEESGINKTRKSRGISIIPEDFPDDPREGWLDMGNRAVVYNTGHPFSKSVENNPSLYDFNLTRVVISSLIKAKNDQTEMDAITTFNYFEKILHDVWL
jgi:hypothetical protein